MHHNRLGTDCLESIFAEKDLGVLVYDYLNMSQQYALVAKYANICVCLRKNIASRLIFPFCFTLVRCTWSAQSRAGLTSMKETWTWSEFKGGP